MTICFQKNRVLALLTALVLLVSMLPAAAGADSIRYAKTSTGESVNVHSAALLTTLNVVGTIPYSGKVTVVSDDGTWSYITTTKVSGYVLSRLLTSVDPGKKPTVTTGTTVSKSATKYVKTGNGGALNVRSTRSNANNKNIIGTVSYGAKVTVEKTYGSWSYISVGKVRGYVLSSLLSATKPATEKVNVKAHTMYVTSGNGKSVNFRSSMKKSGTNIIKALPVGTAVKAYGTIDGWTKVTYGSRTGYIQAAYLTSTKPAKKK